MIIIEDRLQELFETLPTIPSGDPDQPTAQPQFGFGTEKQLLVFLQDFEKQSVYPYPILWYETPRRSTGPKQIRTVSGATFIIATPTKEGWSNKQRLKSTVAQRIEPVAELMFKALRKSGFTRIIGQNTSYEDELFLNYGNPDQSENKVPYIWDAMRITLDLEVTDKCLRTFNY